MEENNYINEQLLKQISVEQKITVPQIKAVLKLIEDGGTVPFIARYRKEVTGNLDEDQIRAINQHWEYGQKLAQRKEDIMRLIEEKGKLTEEIKFSIINANKLSELEDIYRPYKEKKKTRATDAKAKGLEPLAEYLLSFPKEGDVLAEAKKYITLDPTEEQIKNKLVVKNEKEALSGAKDIVAEQISDVAKYRKWLRSFLERRSVMVTKVKDEKLDKGKVFEMYYDYQEPVSEIKNHRILAIDRGESSKILKVNIVEDTERVYKFFCKKVIGIDNESSITAEYVNSAIEDAYSRLIKPSVEREVRATLKEKAEDSAIFVFGENLRKYLLTPPMKGKVVLGLDPAFRTGCKLAVIDNTGKFIFKDKIDPHQHYPGEHVPDSREALAAKKFKETILKYNCEVVAMGNGTASRESEAFVVKCLKEMQKDLKKAKLDVQYIIVNEAGASVYSASKIAQDEFPEFSVEERSAVSIARRLQDPLSELVKIDPKSIGVGQYQHDVNQKKLGGTLDYIVEEAVNNVGVNVNLASVYLLKRVSGLNLKNAKTIVAYRDKNGKYVNRKDLKIKGITAKTLEQAIGFLRIPDGNEKLDMTSIHPESYIAAEAILKKLGMEKSNIGSTELKEAIENSDKKELAQGLEIGEYTFADIIDSLTSPLRDPRDAFDAPLLKSDVTTLDDLYSGMELQGTVRNVVDFGVFVDCGVHEDGLVHISKIKEGYIKHPLDVVSVGDIVKVWVVSVNKSNNRLELTMINPEKNKSDKNK